MCIVNLTQCKYIFFISEIESGLLQLHIGFSSSIKCEVKYAQEIFLEVSGLGISSIFLCTEPYN